MTAVWLDDAEAAAARGMSAAGTSCGISAWRAGSSVARAAPMTKTGEKPSGGEPRERARQRQRQRDKGLDALAEPQDAAPIIAVGDLPDDERQRETRHELRQSDQPQIERAARQRIDLPADRHGLHLEGDGGRDPRPPKEPERPMPPQRGRGGVIHCGAAPAPQSAKGSRTSTVSSRSGLVENSATGASISSSMRRIYLIAGALSCAQERAPRVLSLQPGTVS